MVNDVCQKFINIQVSSVVGWPNRSDRLFQKQFRGAAPSEEEKKILNQQARNILRENGFVLEDEKTINTHGDYDWIRMNNGAGFAHQYLKHRWNDLKMINEADASLYRKLADIDYKLGTSASQQLQGCLMWTTRWDIIKVWTFCMN